MAAVAGWTPAALSCYERGRRGGVFDVRVLFQRDQAAWSAGLVQTLQDSPGRAGTEASQPARAARTADSLARVPA